MFDPPIRLTKPGLFITGTDTGVGKTVATCAIAASLRRHGMRVGVCKPIATGCRRDREGLVSEDAEALAHFADCPLPLDVINPVRYALAVAPAVAAEISGEAVDFRGMARSLELLDEASDCVLVEGIGGLLVPIDHQKPRRTVLDLIMMLGYPVVVVARPVLGTLNHTAMTVRVLEQARCRVAGIVVNSFDADSSRLGDRAADASMSTNRQWIEKMTRLPILATLPACPPQTVAPQRGLIPGEILDAAALTYWPGVIEASPNGGVGASG